MRLLGDAPSQLPSVGCLLIPVLVHNCALFGPMLRTIPEQCPGSWESCEGLFLRGSFAIRCLLFPCLSLAFCAGPSTRLRPGPCTPVITQTTRHNTTHLILNVGTPAATTWCLTSCHATPAALRARPPPTKKKPRLG